MIVIDTETTGLLKPLAAVLTEQPHLTEICLLKIADNFSSLIGEYTTLIKPPVSIPEELEKITGITNSMVATAPTFIQIYRDICEFVVGEKIFIGHNLAFDAGMLYTELARHEKVLQFPWPYIWHCTVELSKPIENKRLHLSELYKKATGKEHINAHRARNDAMATVNCYQWLINMGMVKQ